MDKRNKERRDRLVTLAFVSVLLIVIYGPGAAWFEAADRVLYDQLAGRIGNEPLADGVIVSIDPERRAPAELFDEYGRLIRIIKEQGARRIIIPQLPPIPADQPLPEWAETIARNGPVFVPRNHALAMRATKSGFVDFRPDADDVLRSTQFWQFSDGGMTPSLAVAVALSVTTSSSSASITISSAASRAACLVSATTRATGSPR